jgi:hypothetical protein
MALLDQELLARIWWLEANVRQLIERDTSLASRAGESEGGEPDDDLLAVDLTKVIGSIAKSMERQLVDEYGETAGRRRYDAIFTTSHQELPGEVVDWAREREMKSGALELVRMAFRTARRANEHYRGRPYLSRDVDSPLVAHVYARLDARNRAAEHKRCDDACGGVHGPCAISRELKQAMIEFEHASGTDSAQWGLCYDRAERDFDRTRLGV